MKGDKDYLKEWIMRELPYGGEWWSDGYEKFIIEGDKLLEKFSFEEVKIILANLYNAVSNEYN